MLSIKWSQKTAEVQRKLSSWIFFCKRMPKKTMFYMWWWQPVALNVSQENENEVPVADLPGLELSHHWWWRCCWSLQRRPWSLHRYGGVTTVKHMHISSLLEVSSQCSSCSFSRKQANTDPAAGTVALYGPVCLFLCNDHSCAIAHVLETGLGCCDPVLYTVASWRTRTTCVFYTQQQSTKLKKRNGLPGGTSYSAQQAR